MSFDKSMDPGILNITPDFSEKIEVPKLAVQIMFDALCHSMDFGSGFLDTEEVEALRAVAVILGVDPMQATPHDFKDRYMIPHAFQNTGKDANGVVWRSASCNYCGQFEGYKFHVVEQTNIK